MKRFLIFVFIFLCQYIKAGNTLSLIPTSTIGGDTAWVKINLENDDTAVGLQFDLLIQSGLTLSGDAFLADRASNHLLEISQNNDGSHRFLVYNTDLMPFQGDSGLVLTIGMVTDDYGLFNIVFVNPIIGNAQSLNVLTEASNGTVLVSSPEPQLQNFEMITMIEDSSNFISQAYLNSNVFDANTDIQDLIWLLQSEIFSISETESGFIISPPPNWYGQDAVTVIVSDETYSDTTFIEINVLGINDPPEIIENIPLQTMQEDGLLKLVVSEFFGDSDSDIFYRINQVGQGISASFSSDTLTIQGDDNWNGFSALSIVGFDEEYEVIQNISVQINPINDAPIVSNIIDDIIIHEDSVLVLNLHNYFSDVDSEISFSFFTENGNVLIDIIDSVIVLNPIENYTGEFSISISAMDEDYSVQQNFAVQYLPVNDQPVIITDLPTIQVFEDSSTIVFISELIIDPDSEIQFSALSDSNSVNIVFGGDSILIVPEANWNGSNKMIINYSDGEFSGNFEIELITIAVNDPPERISFLPNVDMFEDTQSSISLDQFYEDIDSEIEFIFTNSDHIIFNIDSTNSLLISLQEHWFGSEVINVSVSDGEYALVDTIIVNVSPVNDAPNDIELLSPIDGDSVQSLNFSLSWDQITDVDEDDLVISLSVKFNNTVSTQIVAGNSISLNAVELQLPYGSVIEWWISAYDGILTTISDKYNFIIPESIKYKGPIWYVSKSGNDLIADGSQTYPFNEIQKAIISSNNLDSIFVSGGVYFENLSWQNKAISIIGLSNEEITINGSGSNSVMTFGESQINESHFIQDTNRIENLILTNGSSEISAGGIFIGNGNFVLKNCTILDSEVGTGLQAVGSKVKIQNCIVDNNYSPTSGGGMYFSGTTAFISNSTIKNNTSLISGGGIKINSSFVDIFESKIENNSVSNSLGFGGGVSISSDSYATIVRTIIDNNSSVNDASALHLENNSTVSVINSNMVNNLSSASSIQLNGDCSLNIVNSIVWGNTSNTSINDSQSNLSISYSNIFGGQQSIDNPFNGTFDWGVGNISQDPHFVNGASNYNLLFTSPCIDAGHPDLDDDNITWELDSDDWDPDGTRLDIGVYHYEQQDDIPPTVSLDSPTELSVFHTSQVDTVKWTASDDKVLTWAIVSISIDDGFSYADLDTVLAKDEMYLITPEPWMITSLAKIAIKISDRGGNIAQDETDFSFSILDGTPPQLSIISPEIGTSYPENEILLVQWEAQDNGTLGNAEIFFSQNGGQFFNSVGSAIASSGNFQFTIPYGITDIALVKIVVNDLSGNVKEQVSNFFNVTDNTPPEIFLDNLSANEVGTRDSVFINWVATDNSFILDYHKILFSPYYNQGFELIDSVAGINSEYLWFPPDVITNQARLKIITYDDVGLFNTDTSESFSIVDNWSPLVEVSLGAPNFSVPEGDSMNVIWNAFDNIQMDSLFIYYHNNTESSELFIDKVSYQISELSFEVPYGITDSAYVKVEGKDVYGNIGFGQSEYFSVTDKTVPNVEIEPVDSIGTSDLATIRWNATDNGGLFASLISLSLNAGNDFIVLDTIYVADLLDQNLDETNLDFSFEWMALDSILDQCMFKVDVLDKVGLISSDTTQIFNIYDNDPPLIYVLNPSTGFVINEYDTISVNWVAYDNSQVDSVRILFSNDGGENFSFIDEADANEDQVSFVIPSGVTDSAVVKIEAFDIYENQSFGLSNYFSIADFSPPLVDVETIQSSINIEDSLLVSWISTDDSDISHNDIFFRSSPVMSFQQIATLSGDINEYIFIAPNLVTDSAQILIEASEIIGLTGRDTSIYFSINDRINPFVSINENFNQFSILEYENIYLSWEAYDNIQIDSIYIFYSVNNDSSFYLISSLDTNNSEFSFPIPNGISESARIKLVVKDIFNNEAYDTTEYFSVLDNTLPEVSISTSSSAFIYETIDINWLAYDASGFHHHKLYFSDDINNSFVIIDSLPGSQDFYQWEAPNLVTSQARFKIISTDNVGLSSSDTSSYFSVLDNIPPSINIETNFEGIEVPEYHPIEIHWIASDNISLDSVYAFFSNDSGESFYQVGLESASNNFLTFNIPPGLTNYAQVVLEVYDSYENFSSDSSFFFTVTDYSPPTATLNNPKSGDSFDIDGNMIIDWNAQDNVNVTSINLDYTIDGGVIWKNIISNFDNIGQYNWTVPNDPSSNAIFRVIAFDAIGLTDTSIVDSVSIDIVYPKIVSLDPEPGGLNWLEREVAIQFSQKMDEQSFNSQSITFHSNNSGEIKADFLYVDSIQTVYVSVPQGFASLDTIRITLNSSEVNNYYGYALDGDGDGNGGDSFVIEYVNGLVGDIDDNSMINGADLSLFLDAYEQNNYLYEMGPYSGQVPRIDVQHDSIFNIEDIMSFVVMGNWYLETYGLNMTFLENNDIDLDVEVNKESISISMPSKASSFDLEIVHNGSNFIPNYLSNDGSVSLVHKDLVKGHFQMISELNSSKLIHIPFELNGEHSNIELYVNAYGEDGEIVSQLRKKIDIKTIPDHFTLSQNFPNPFNPTTKIKFGLPKASEVSITIYNIMGKVVKELIDDFYEPGFYSISWNGTDQIGRNVGAGMYFYKVSSGDFIEVKKMILLK